MKHRLVLFFASLALFGLAGAAVTTNSALAAGEDDPGVPDIQIVPEDASPDPAPAPDPAHEPPSDPLTDHGTDPGVA